MINLAQDPLANPADMTDPENQRKTAANVLSQLGLHPDQMGARNLLDNHFQGMTAHPDVKALIEPRNGVSNPPNDLINANAPDSGGVPASEVATLGPATANSPARGEMLNTAGGVVQPAVTPNVPGPSGTPIMSPLIPQIEGDISENMQKRQDLINAGSGISRIHNPFLRFLGHAGEVGANLFAPGITGMIPGTEWYHGNQVKNMSNLINDETSEESKIAGSQYSLERAANPKAAAGRVNDLSVWMQENPDKPIEQYWLAKKTAGQRLTPDEQVMRYLTMPVEQGGEGMDPASAQEQVLKTKANLRPMTGAAYDQKNQALLEKAAGGKLDPKTMLNPQALADLITNSPALTDDEKGQLAAHFIYKTSPASAGGIQSMRGQAQKSNRLWPAIDKTTGNLTFASPLQVQQEPGRYLPATQGIQTMNKEGLFSDIHLNIDLVQDAMNNLKNGFSPQMRGQLALLLREQDPRNGMMTFLNSAAASTLTPDQVDFITSLAALSENSMMLRGIQGMGQSSMDMRAAIRAMLPGAGTPDAAYGNRQLELLKGTVSRIEQGVPHSGVPRPELPTPAKTGQSAADKAAPTAPQAKASKTFTKAQVQEQAAAHHIPYAKAVKQAFAAGHTVIGEKNPNATNQK